MSSIVEFQRLKREPGDNKSRLFIQFPHSELYFEYNSNEWRPAMHFVRHGIGEFLRDTARPIIIPPPSDDEGMHVENHFFKHCENVFSRAYIALLSRHRVYTSPALLLADPETTVDDFLEQLDRHFGNTLRIVSPNAVTKHWGGKLDEFDDIIRNDGKRYRRRTIKWSQNNDKLYATGISVRRYLELLETHPPDPHMSYEDYFQELRREAKRGNIPGIWKTEELFPDQPHLFLNKSVPPGR